MLHPPTIGAGDAPPTAFVNSWNEPTVTGMAMKVAVMTLSAEFAVAQIRRSVSVVREAGMVIVPRSGKFVAPSRLTSPDARGLPVPETWASSYRKQVSVSLTPSWSVTTAWRR